MFAQDLWQCNNYQTLQILTKYCKKTLLFKTQKNKFGNDDHVIKFPVATNHEDLIFKHFSSNKSQKMILFCKTLFQEYTVPESKNL